MPKNSTKVAKFRRYFLSGATGAAGNTGSGSVSAFYNPLSTTALVEGVTPAGKQLANQDYTVTLAQYGNFVTITDVIMDTHEDRVLQQAIDILGEEAAQVLETLRFNVLKAGVNVFYANGSARTDVNTVHGPVRPASRHGCAAPPERQADHQHRRARPGLPYGAGRGGVRRLHPPDMEITIRSITGFIPTKQYGTVTPWESEIGAVESACASSPGRSRPRGRTAAATSARTSIRPAA